MARTGRAPHARARLAAGCGMVVLRAAGTRRSVFAGPALAVADVWPGVPTAIIATRDCRHRGVVCLALRTAPRSPRRRCRGGRPRGPERRTGQRVVVRAPGHAVGVGGCDA